jgi:hypothetical protein
MAVLEQERHVELVPNANELFFITNLMVSAVIPDQLPHLNVFVILVADVDDPTEDALARVANLADLTLVPIGRAAGIAAPGVNGIEYLSTATTVTYETLETANDAAVAFRDRVNALITAWITFRTEFNAPTPTPAQYILPVVDPSQKQALIDAYSLAKQSTYQKQLQKTEADAALTRAQTDYTYKQNLVTGATALVSGATLTQSDFTTTVGQFGTLLVAGNTFYSLNPAGTGFAAFAAALATATLQQSAMTTFLVNSAGLVTDATNYNSARITDASTANTAVTAAQLDQTTKTQLLASAVVLEATALAAVLAVCPDFDATTIPYVPG